MCPADDGPNGSRSDDLSSAARLAALERQVTTLSAEVAALRDAVPMRSATQSLPAPPASLRGPPRIATADLPPRIGGQAWTRVRSSVHAAMRGVEIESLVGRYVTLLFAALVILMAVGALIKVAVINGLLTPGVRVGFGALAAGLVGATGVYFHRKGEVRYANVLLALSLAMVDLVAWGAGPRLHLVPTVVALVVVDIVATALAALALHDESEFLFSVAVAGALSSPFVTSDHPGTPTTLLVYGACILVGALRAVRQPHWLRAFTVLVAGALFYALAAAGLPAVQGWHAPYLLMLFAGACALGALLLAERAWRGNLSRAYLAIGLVGLPVGWDRMLLSPPTVTLTVAIGVALVTFAALAERADAQPLWVPSALVLPVLSLGIASTAVRGDAGRAAVLAVSCVVAVVSWQLERRRAEDERAGVHLLVGGLLGAGAVGALLWPFPLPLVAGLAGWGVMLSLAVRSERRPFALIAVASTLGAAAASAMDQLASRQAYAYVPFTTRSSASALCAALGLAAGSATLARGRGSAVKSAERPTRLGIVIGFMILWGRMEVARAFNADLAAFLLIAYYAACGVASILVGRHLAIQRLRLAGLALAIYAAVKAAVEASEIGGVALRVGAYGAVGVFLLGAGYLYRERRGEIDSTSPQPLADASSVRRATVTTDR